MDLQVNPEDLKEEWVLVKYEGEGFLGMYVKYKESKFLTFK